MVSRTTARDQSRAVVPFPGAEEPRPAGNGSGPGLADRSLRILIADPCCLRRRGLLSLVTETPGLRLAAEVRNEAALTRALGECRPDVLVLEKDLVSAETLTALRRLNPKVRVVALHGDWDPRTHHADVDGILSVDATPDEILEILWGGRLPATGHGSDPYRQLSARELLLLRCLGSCMTLQEAAVHMQVRPTTASTYRRRLLDKLGLPSTAHLIRFAVRRGLET